MNVIAFESHPQAKADIVDCRHMIKDIDFDEWSLVDGENVCQTWILNGIIFEGLNKINF